MDKSASLPADPFGFLVDDDGSAYYDGQEITEYPTWDPWIGIADFQGSRHRAMAEYTSEDLAGRAGRTQISRGGNISAPTRTLIERGLIRGRVLHHGAGQAQADTAAMLAAGAESVVEYDPYGPTPEIRDASALDGRYDVVISNYVLNVLPTDARRQVLADLARVTGGKTYITVRGVGDKSIRGEAFDDGVITGKGTFQKGYRPETLADELGAWFGSVSIIAGNTQSPGSITAEVRDPHPDQAGFMLEANHKIGAYDDADDADAPLCDLCGEPMGYGSETAEVTNYARNGRETMTSVMHFACAIELHKEYGTDGVKFVWPNGDVEGPTGITKQARGNRVFRGMALRCASPEQRARLIELTATNPEQAVAEILSMLHPDGAGTWWTTDHERAMAHAWYGKYGSLVGLGIVLEAKGLTDLHEVMHPEPGTPITVIGIEVCDDYDADHWVHLPCRITSQAARKGDGVDTCKFCGSDNLMGSYFDREGYGANTDAGGASWDLLCQDCGKFQIRRNRKQSARESGYVVVTQHGADLTPKQAAAGWTTDWVTASKLKDGDTIVRPSAAKRDPATHRPSEGEFVDYGCYLSDKRQQTQRMEARDLVTISDVHQHDFFKSEIVFTIEGSTYSLPAQSKIMRVVRTTEAVGSDPYGWGTGSAMAVLHDEPEPALPSTDATTEEAEDDDPMSPAAIEQREALLGGKSDESEIAAAAHAYLAKLAVKRFTPLEQMELIEEGEREGVTASNLDRLEIAGTHYEALEDRYRYLDQAQTAAEDLFL